MIELTELPCGQQVKLLPITDLHRADYIALSMDNSVMQFVGNPKTEIEAVEDFDTRAKYWSLDNERWLALAVTDIKTGDFAGDVAIKPIEADAKKAEVGFIIKPGFQGRGIGSEAMGLLIDLAFNTLKLNKLVAYCDVRNAGSYKALEKCGFVREGTLRQNAFIMNEYVDDYVYGLCASDL